MVRRFAGSPANRYASNMAGSRAAGVVPVCAGVPRQPRSIEKRPGPAAQSASSPPVIAMFL